MAKKKRIRRNPNNLSIEEFKSDVKKAYTEIITKHNSLDIRVVANYAELFISWARRERLNQESFLLTKWGKAALSTVWEIIKDLDDQGLSDADTPENAPQNIKARTLVVSGYLGTAAFLWEMVLGFANYEKLREKPYENEDLFHFLSTATFRYQFIYRALEIEYPGDPQTRHAVCRFIASSSDSPADVQNDRITAHIMTELWVSGVNNFTISTRLRNRFMLTDIDNIDVNSVSLPYPAFIVTTPSETLMFAAVDHPNSDARVWCIYNQERGVVQLRIDTDKQETLGDLWRKLPDNFWDQAPEAEEACQEAFQLICNLMLYLQCKDAEVTTRKVSTGKQPPERKQRELRSYGKRQITPITHILYPSLSDTSREKTSGSRTHTREHWVRGHYRWQPYWPHGRDADPVKKRIWIEPHLRGSPEDSDNDDMNSRKYRV